MYTFCSVTCTVVAKAVLDRCIETNAVSEEDPTKIEVEFNYEFLEDETGRQDRKKEWIKQWKTNKGEKHPLALMVSYF